MATSPVTITPDKAPGVTGVTITPDAPVEPQLTGKAGMDAALNNPTIQDLGHGDQAAGAAAAVEGGRGVLTAAAKPLMVPSSTTSQVGTGILDEFGNEILKQVTKLGPSRLAALASKLGEYAGKSGVVAKFPGGALAEKLILGDMLSKGKMHEGLMSLFGIGEE